jgi:hypothetical protein
MGIVFLLLWDLAAGVYSWLVTIAVGRESLPAALSHGGFLVKRDRDLRSSGKDFRSTTALRYVTLLAAVFVPLLVGCVREKDRLDDEVRQLCAKDGGIKIYERAQLTADRFDKQGFINFYRRTATEPLGAEYIFESKIDYYRKGNPEMWRNIYRVVRRSDGRVLGESVSYSRRGGDLPGPWHESSFGCPDDAGDAVLLRQVFVKAD